MTAIQGASDPGEEMQEMAAPVIAEEQILVARKLESIFMPHAHRQRNKLYKVQTGEEAATSRKPIRFAHYTTAEAALSIIRTKRFWMRNTTCMADYREVRHGFDILKTFFSDKAKLQLFVAALDSCVPGAAMEAMNLFDPWSNETSPTSIQLNTYIASLSEHDKSENTHGRLSMWRAFKNTSPRVALVFNVPWYTGAADALNIIFSPVAYLDEPRVHGVIQEVINNIKSNGDFLKTLPRPAIVNTVFNMLLAGMTCLKHDGFGEEREWRAVYTPKIRQSPLMNCSTEVIEGVPQSVYVLPLDRTVADVLSDLDISAVFDSLIIGPSPYPWVMHEAFTDALKEIKSPNASRVFISNIPIRS